MEENKRIIDGRKIAREHEAILRDKIKSLGTRPLIVSILVGDDPASVLYSNIKQKKAHEVGIGFELKKFPETADFRQVSLEIEKLNQDPQVTGIMIQLPLPDNFLKDFKEEDLIRKIDPKKDVDGLTGQGLVLHATVKAILSIFEAEDISVQDKIVAVVGSTGMVGTPLVQVLKQMGARVLELNSKTENLNNFTKQADIIISTVGKKNLITADSVKNGAVVIDVGMDVDFEGVYPKASKITPPTGGVGPVTVISLLENVLQL